MRICFFIRWPEKWFEWSGTYNYVGWEIGNPTVKRHFLSACGSILTMPLRGTKLLVAKRLHDCEILSCHRVHNVPTFPSPSPPPKILYIAIISNFFCVLQSSQEKSKTMVKPNFFFWGGGVKKMHYGLGEKSEISILHSCWNEITV